MQEVSRVITFGKNHGKSITPHCTLPRSWLEDMQVTESDRSVTMKFDDKSKKIIITKEI